MIQPVRFGFTGKWAPNFQAVQQAAWLNKSDATPVGVEAASIPQGSHPATPVYRVVTHQDYWKATQIGRIAWTALA